MGIENAQRNHVESNVLKFDGSGFKQFFSGRSDSIKTKCVDQVNKGVITLDKAWEDLAKNFLVSELTVIEKISTRVSRK